MLEPHPEWLYRYRPNGTSYFEDEIDKALQGKIFLSSAGNLNDPFDFKPCYEYSDLKNVLELLKKIHGRKPSVSRKRVERIVNRPLSRTEYRQYSKKLRPSVLLAKTEIVTGQKIIQDQGRFGRLACFSEERQNIPMWAHYANDHKGICLVYKLSSDLVDYVNDIAPFKVKYQDVRPVLNTLDLMRFANKYAGKLEDSTTPEKVMEAVYLRKSKHWSYEKEWRLFDFSREDPKYHRVPSLEVQSVVVGMRADEETIRTVKEIVNSRVEVLKLSVSRDRFGFDEVEVSQV